MGKKVHPVLIKLSVLAVALNEVSAGATAPAMDAMIKAFEGQHSVTTVMLISSIPSICMFIFAPIFGKVADRFTRRQLVFFSLIIFIIGGTAPAFLSESLYAILAMRALLGVAVAIIMPLSLLLIDDYFSGPERDTMIGWNVAAQMIGGAIFQLAGGYLASIDWRFCFFAYLFPIWVIVLVYFGLPNPERRAMSEAHGLNKEILKEKFPPVLYLVYLIYILFTMFHYTVATNIAIMIIASGFGDPSSVGIAITFMTAGSFVCGLFYGKLYKALPKVTMSLGILAVSIGYGICYYSTSLGMVIVGCILAGVALGVAMPAFMSKVQEESSSTNMAMAMSLLVASMGIGQFLQPVIMNPILYGIGLDVGRDAFGFAAVVLFVLALVAVFFNRNNKMKLETADLNENIQ